MKIVINLSKAEENGINNYLEALSEEVTPNITPEDIEIFISDSIHGNLHWEKEAVSGYVFEEEKEKEKNLICNN